MGTLLRHVNATYGMFLVLVMLTALSCKKESIGYPTPLLYMTFDESVTYVGEEISFTNQSEYSDSYEWDFGDGTTSSEPNPSHTYTKEGEYIITLSGVGEGGEMKEKFPISIKKQTFLGNWKLVQVSFDGADVLNTTGTLRVEDETNYSADFVQGNNKGKVTAKYTVVESVLLSNANVKIAIVNGKSSSGTATQQLWSTEIFCSKTLYDNYLKYSLGMDKPEVSFSGKYLILKGNGGKALLKYQKE